MADNLDPLEPSPYKTLNVLKDAPLSTIRSAHRKLVLLYHPDKVQNEDEKKTKAELFHQVQQAYEILSDDNRRRRWDDRARLAELRAEILEERPRPPPRRSETFAAPRTAQPPVFEVRGGRVYEERVPKSARAYTEDFGSPFAEARPSSRKYEDTYDETPSRKTSGRGPDDRRRHTVEDERWERKEREKREKAEEKKRRERRDAERARDRRRDLEAKSRSQRAYVEEESSDSEPGDSYFPRASEPKSKRRDEDSRRYREEPSRMYGRKGNPRSSDEALERKENAAYEYMRRSSEQVDLDTRHSGRKRADSYRDQVPMSPPLTPVDGGRRSSGDDGRKATKGTHSSRPPSPVRKSTKGKPKIEIMEPPPVRKPNMPVASSDRSYLQKMASSKGRGEPQRSATDVPPKKFAHPGLSRSETMPIDNMRRGASQPSKHKKTLDPSDISSESSSGSDTESDDDVPPPPPPPRRPQPQARQQSTRYRVALGEEDRSSRTVYVSPDEMPHSRDDSPKNPRRATTDRPDRHTPRPSPIARAATFQERPSTRNNYGSYREESPRLKTHQSARGEKSLFGEVTQEEPSPKATPKFFPISKDDRDDRSYSRRGSKDVDKDYSPRSHQKAHRRPHAREIST
ncbi:uncharacterized protein KY384_000924 [Bacidia gigantensis]|uniref:uncharacterized protein n=1 Tax=Bacidia gigantensis TaxID=2732470 RepID=UPI001D048730|nr:uncharacterized protein KY384_000924 [Bacidia gigantensis]KAG8534081.1 hypothetical protein KY384_000924 [Bacidia gigantensis]